MWVYAPVYMRYYVCVCAWHCLRVCVCVCVCTCVCSMYMCLCACVCVCVPVCVCAVCACMSVRNERRPLISTYTCMLSSPRRHVCTSMYTCMLFSPRIHVCIHQHVYMYTMLCIHPHLGLAHDYPILTCVCSESTERWPLIRTCTCMLFSPRIHDIITCMYSPAPIYVYIHSHLGLAHHYPYGLDAFLALRSEFSFAIFRLGYKPLDLKAHGGVGQCSCMYVCIYVCMHVCI